MVLICVAFGAFKPVFEVEPAGDHKREGVQQHFLDGEVFEGREPGFACLTSDLQVAIQPVAGASPSSAAIFSSLSPCHHLTADMEAETTDLKGPALFHKR